jgi:hypothetical protein
MKLRRALPLLCALALGGCGEQAPGPAKDPPGATIVWAVGDGGSSGDAASRVAGLIAHDDPDRVIYLGDVYDDGTRAEFQTNFAAIYGDLVERMWPTPGNHEWANRAEGYAPFWREVLGERLPYHYAREAGGWEVLSANSETPDDPRQLAWLRRRTAAGGNCRIAFWHHPRLNAGRHGGEVEEVEPLWDAVAGRTAIVLSGHDHNLQRFEPVDGTAQYISGAGGRSRYAVDDEDPRLAFADDGTEGALRIALTPGRAELRFVAADGTILDTSTVTCED